MARLFDDAASDKISASTAGVTAVPLTLVGWFNADALPTPDMTIVSLVDTNADNSFQLLTVNAAKVRARASAGGTVNSAQTAATFTTGSWHHAAAVFTSDSSRAVFLNGGNKATSSVTVGPPTGIDSTLIGAKFEAAAYREFWSGMLAEVGVYNAALTDSEVAALWRGFSPLLIRPQSLVAYAPLIRDVQDLRGGIALTTTGTSVADHPRVIYAGMPLSYALHHAVVAGGTRKNIIGGGVGGGVLGG